MIIYTARLEINFPERFTIQTNLEGSMTGEHWWTEPSF